MPTVSDVEQALRVADALPPGEEQVERSEQALAMAEQVDDFALLVQARINLVAAYDAAAPGDRELPHIAWLLGCLEGDPDGDPDQVTDRQRFEILWECRFALARTRRSSRMPLEVVQRVYRDIERRFRAEGVSPHLYAKYRALLARDIDTDEVLEHWLGVWRASPRDALSDCEVCDIAADARFLAEAGDPAGALERAGRPARGPQAVRPRAAPAVRRGGRLGDAPGSGRHRRGLPPGRLADGRRPSAVRLRDGRPRDVPGPHQPPGACRPARARPGAAARRPPRRPRPDAGLRRRGTGAARRSRSPAGAARGRRSPARRRDRQPRRQRPRARRGLRPAQPHRPGLAAPVRAGPDRAVPRDRLRGGPRRRRARRRPRTPGGAEVRTAERAAARLRAGLRGRAARGE